MKTDLAHMGILFLQLVCEFIACQMADITVPINLLSQTVNFLSHYSVNNALFNYWQSVPSNNIGQSPVFIPPLCLSLMEQTNLPIRGNLDPEISSK